MTDDGPDGSGGLDGLRERLDRMNHAILGEEEQAILVEAREQARQDPGVRAWLRGLPREKDGTRAAVLGARVADMETRGALILEEFAAVSALGEQVSDSRDVLHPFRELTEAAASKYRRPRRDRLGRLLGSAAPAAGRWGADLLQDSIGPSGTELVLRLHSLLEQDAGWRVRDQPRRTLEVLEPIPAGVRPRLLDRLRARLQSRM